MSTDTKQIVSKGINIGHINVYHLGNKVHDICRMLKDADIHLLGLTETRLNLQPDEQISISGYTFWRKDKNTEGQHGLGLYISDTIISNITRCYDFESKEMECMWVQFKRNSKDTPLLLCFMYRNCACDFSWYDHFFAMMIKVYEKHPKADVALMGDFNLDLLKPQIPWRTTFSSFGLQQLVNKPTRVAKKGDKITSTLLDHIYSNNSAKVSNIRFSDVCVSDHNATICTWTCKPIHLKSNNNQNHKTIEYRCFKKFDQNSFLYELSLCDFTQVYQCTNSDNALETWYSIFSPLLDKHAPIRKKRIKQREHKEAITPEILAAMKQRDNFKANGQFEEYKKLRNKVNDMVRNSESNIIKEKVKNSRHTGEIWHVMNYITYKCKNKNLFNNIKASADDFNSFFLSFGHSETKSKQTSSDTSDYFLNLVEKFCMTQNPTSQSCRIPLISVLEVGKYLSNLASKKSTGLDSISPFFLKLSLPYIVESLTYIYNLCITTNTFPKLWKEAKVVPIPKTKDSCNLNQFRPISLLSVLSKPLERHIKYHMYEFVENKSLFHILQSGFRKNHSCNSALTQMCDSWLSSLNNSLICGTIFLDFKKAFDLVNHDTLLRKIKLYTNNENTTALISSFLDNRMQRVLLNGKLSNPGILNTGVPQGSILGPLLFCLYINDLPLAISNPAVSCYLFADDGTLSSANTSVDKLQQVLQIEMDNVSAWSKANRMIIHPDKTKSMVITSRQKHQLSDLRLQLHVDSNKIQSVDNHKVLGVIVDKELRWEQHIHSICNKVSRNLYLLFKLKPYLDTESMKTFYYAHCLSHFNYCSIVWGMSKTFYMKKLNQLHRRAAKVLNPSENLSTDEKLSGLGFLPLRKQFIFNTLVQMFKVHIHESTPNLQSLFTQRGNRYILPKTRIDLFKSSFSFQGAIQWNSLPLEIRLSTSIQIFKDRLKTFLLDDHG